MSRDHFQHCRRLGLHARVEFLERRALLSVVPLDPLTQPKFVNPLPNPLDPSFIFQPTTAGGSHYEIGIRQFRQSLGLVDPVTGDPYQPNVWGYGTDTQTPTYPGRTIVAQRDEQITVDWLNELVDAAGDPLPHLLPIDPTLHWADPLEAGHVEGPYAGPVPVVTHLHGGHTRSDSDGLPDAWFTPDSNDAGDDPDYTGRLYNPTYTYDNDQQAATLWYHDHALGVTRLNVYAGLAGYYILRDAVDTGQFDNPLDLPAGPYEIPIVIQDRMFYGPGTTDDPQTPWAEAPGELFYPATAEGDDEEALEDETAPDPTHQPEFFGDHILVNGQAWPVLDVEPRAYRFRLLNGSDSRFYNLLLSSGQQINQIGSDTGLLPAPVVMDRLTLGPGERADVIIDFSNPALWGQTVVVRNNAKTPFPSGSAVDPRTTGQIMAFRVNQPLDAGVPSEGVPDTLVGPIPSLVEEGVDRTRGLLLFEGTDHYGRLQAMLGIVDPSRPALDGSLAWDDDITEQIRLGDVEVWEIYNNTADAHPIHLHLASFQVLSRQRFTATVSAKPMGEGATGGVLSDVRLRGKASPPAANEVGWKDTVIMYPGEVTRIVAKFDRPGEYVWHCHILSHEDHEMMRPYEVIDPEDDASANSASGIVDAAATR